MSRAYIDDYTGKPCKGKGITSLLVPITDTFALLIHPQEIVDESHTRQGEISPETAGKISGFLTKALAKPPTKKDASPPK